MKWRSIALHSVFGILVLLPLITYLVITGADYANGPPYNKNQVIVFVFIAIAWSSAGLSTLNLLSWKYCIDNESKYVPITASL